MLSLLSENIPPLPNDVRTLKSTPRKIVRRGVEPGEYVHYGIEDALTDFLNNFDYSNPDIYLNLNVDGLPLFKSSRKQVWPILIMLYEGYL